MTNIRTRIANNPTDRIYGNDYDRNGIKPVGQTINLRKTCHAKEFSLKILHIINSLTGGGAERLVSQMVPQMLRQNHECDILVLSKKNDSYSCLMSNIGVRVIFSPRNQLFDPRLVRDIIKAVSQKPYDIVHAHLFPCLYWTAIATRLVKYKGHTVVTEHNTHNRRRSVALLRHIERVIYGQYSAIISISSEVEESLKEWLKFPEPHQRRYYTINNGIPLEEFDIAQPLKRIDVRVPEEAILICMVGSFTTQKNHETIIRTMALLPVNTHLILVGDGPKREEIIQQVTALGLEPRVHFLGFRTDVARIMKMSDIVVIPSLWEGFGLVAVEAMACAKPIVAANVPGLREVVLECGLLTDPRSSKDIAAKICAYINNTSLRHEHAKLGKRLSREFSIEKMIINYLDLYNELVHGENR